MKKVVCTMKTSIGGTFGHNALLFGLGGMFDEWLILVVCIHNMVF